MVYIVVIVAVLVGFVTDAQAVTRYLSKTGNNSNTCVQSESPSTPKLTWASAKACMAAGDTLMVESGTYNESFDIRNLTGTDANRYRIIGYGATRPIFLAQLDDVPPTYSCRSIINNSTTNGVWIEYIKFTGEGVCPMPAGRDFTGNRVDGPSNVTFYNNEFSYVTGNMTVIRATNILFSGNVHHDALTDCVPSFRYYAFYVHSSNQNITIEDSDIYNMPGGGIQVYPGGSTTVIIRRNRIHHNSWCTTTPQGGVTVVRDVSSAGAITGVEIYDNLIYKNGSPTGGTAHGIRVAGDITGVKIYNNTIYANENNSESGSPAYGIILQNATCPAGTCAPINTDIKNNLVIANEGGQISTTVGTGTTLSNNITSGVASDYFVDASADDYRLKQGTNTARDAGTSVSSRISGVGSIDVGAYEQGAVLSASVVSGFIDVSFSVLTPSLIPSNGITGFSVSCVGCSGTPSVSQATLLSGSTVRLTIIGLASSGSCTISLGSSNLADSGHIGPESLGLSQYVNSFSGQSVSGTCVNTAGGGGSLPGTPYIIYEFDDNLSDTSGNNLHASSNGTSFVTAKYYKGIKTDYGQDDYVEIPYFSGVSPSTQSLTIAGGVYIDPADVCTLRAVGGTDPGTNQYFHLYYSGCTWKMLIQESTAVATEFTVQSGWNHVCINFNAATDTATLYINRTAGASSGASVQTYTGALTFAGNFRIGRFVGSSLAAGPNHIYDRWVVYQSVADCTQIYDNWEPAGGTWTGTISIASARFYMAKLDALGDLIPMTPAINTNVTLPSGAAAAVVLQADCTVTNCTTIGQKLYYSCIACPSGGSELPVPDSASTDGISLWGNSLEHGLLSGAHGENLSGALTHVNGGTHLVGSSVLLIDLPQDGSTVERWIVKIDPSATSGRQYCLKAKEQTGASLNGYTPSGGICITTGTTAANAGP